MGNVLYIDKPSGMTSFDLCYKLRPVLHTRRIGHTGTLDPLATGVMVILYEKATKANQFLVSANKSYHARVKLGIKTDTLDIEGNIIEHGSFTVPEKQRIIEALDSFLGDSKQIVPLTSAIRVDGKRLYQYQQENREVELPVRDISIYSISLNNTYEDGFSFDTTVSSGTYIRALARDVLEKLDLIGCVSELRRTAIDDIAIEQCNTLEDVMKGNYVSHDLYEILSKKYETIDYPDPEIIRNGKKILVDSVQDQILIVHEEEVLAIYEKEGDAYRCQRGLW
ncbi:MAG: tRNA pseudouridine(55) synthase TruB [Erysipelotrichaceae bacterium]|nr:tRNA pseudouridine(55) synthase TruB [Erysipelotrichaceae bacterium]